MTVLVVMGVSGCGKSTVARVLAGRLGWPRVEGDDFHSEANVAKMAAGHPLTDADRWPWLNEIAVWIRDQSRPGRNGIVTCSALARRYRDVLRGPGVVFVHLTGDRALLASRLGHRHGHFMPASLLDSQLATLEPPGADECAVTVDVADTPSGIADTIMGALKLTPAP